MLIPYISMPFGLSNAGSVYSQMQDVTMAHLAAEFWLSYLNDILVYSTDPCRGHLEHLRKAVQAHTPAATRYSKRRPR